MVEDLGCPRSFAESLLKSIADNFKDGTKAVKNESSYSSRHASTPEHEKGAEEIVSKHEREAKKASSDLLNVFNKQIKITGNNDEQSSLYSSRHISTQNEEKGAQTQSKTFGKFVKCKKKNKMETTYRHYSYQNDFSYFRLLSAVLWQPKIKKRL
jgi:hypothetical protein